MGRAVPNRYQVVARQVGRPEPLFPVHGADTPHHLHDQCRGGIPPPGTQDHQDKRRFPQRRRSLQTCIPCLPKHTQKVDTATPKLRADRTADGHPFRRQICHNLTLT